MALLPEWSSSRFAPRLAGAVAAVAHAPALFNRLLRDDVSSIRDNVDLRTLTGLARAVTRAADLPDSDPGASPIVRPVHAAFEWLVWELVRAQPMAQHAVSIALHALVAALVVRLLLAQKIDVRIALASTLLFAAHPATAAAVAALSSRAVLLGGLALVWSAVRAAEAKTTRAHAAWIAAGVVTSALAHEAYVFSAVPLFFLARREWRRLAAGAAATATLAALVVVMPGLPVPPESLGVAAGILLHALAVAFVPPNASSFFTPTSLAAPLAIVVLFSIATTAVLAARRVGALAGMGLSLALLAAIALAPAAARAGFASDRSAFVVLLGLAFAGAAVAEHVRPRVATSSRLIAFAPFAVAAVLALLTWVQVMGYRDDRAASNALAADRPDDPEGKLARALLASESDDHATAYPICADYASAHPANTRAHLCVGTALLAGGDPEGAVVFLRRYADLHPDEERARRALAAALFATNQLPEMRAWVVRWRATYAKAPDVEAARIELARRGAW